MRGIIVGILIFLSALCADAFAKREAEQPKIYTSIRIACNDWHEISMERSDGVPVNFKRNISPTDMSSWLYEVGNVPKGTYTVTLKRGTGNVMSENRCGLDASREAHPEWFRATKEMSIEVPEGETAFSIDYDPFRDEPEMLRISGNGIRTLYEDFDHDKTLSKEEGMKKYKDSIKNYDKWYEAMEKKRLGAKKKSSK